MFGKLRANPPTVLPIFLCFYLGLACGGCGSPKSETPAAPPPSFALDARQFFDRRSAATVEWPGRPTWNYVTWNDDCFYLAAHPPDDPEKTIIRVPLPKGEHQLTGLASLRRHCEFPVVLIGHLAHTTQTLFAETFHPGKIETVKLQFAIPNDDQEIELRLTMADKAENNHNATLTIKKFKIEAADQLEKMPNANAAVGSPHSATH